jgi:hypothetical protein
MNNAETWLPATLTFETTLYRKSIAVYLDASEDDVGSHKSWRVYAAFGRHFDEPSDEASSLIFNSILNSDINSRVFVSTNEHAMLPCQICEIEDIPDSQVFEICSNDQPAFKLVTRRPK